MDHLQHSFFVSSQPIDLEIDGMSCTRVGEYFVGCPTEGLRIPRNAGELAISFETVTAAAQAAPDEPNTVSIRDHVLTIRGSDMNTQCIYYLHDPRRTRFVVFNDLFLSRHLLRGFGLEARYTRRRARDLTFFAGLERLDAGEELTVTKTGPTLDIAVHRFSNILAADGEIYEDIEQSRAALFERLNDAVRRHVNGEAVTNIALSGGVDSGTIAYLTCQHHAHVEAHTVTTDWGDEYTEAKETADALGIRLHAVHVTSDEILAEVERIVRFFFFVDLEQIEIALVAHCLHQRVMAGGGAPKVFLTGYGSDLLNAGVFRPFDEYAQLHAEILSRLRAAQISNEFSSLGALACGVRVHHPFWASPVIATALRVPASHKVVDGQDKFYVREMMAGRLPAATVWRKKRAVHHGTGVAARLADALCQRLGVSNDTSGHWSAIDRLHEEIFAHGRFAMPVNVS